MADNDRTLNEWRWKSGRRVYGPVTEQGVRRIRTKEDVNIRVVMIMEWIRLG
jgi:hypothetical protein